LYYSTVVVHRVCTDKIDQSNKWSSLWYGDTFAFNVRGKKSSVDYSLALSLLLSDCSVDYSIALSLLLSDCLLVSLKFIISEAVLLVRLLNHHSAASFHRTMTN